MAEDQTWGNWKDRRALAKIEVFPKIPLTDSEKNLLFKAVERELVNFYSYIMISKHCTEQTTQDFEDLIPDGRLFLIRCLVTYDKSKYPYSSSNYSGKKNPKTLQWHFCNYFRMHTHWSADKCVARSISDQKNSKRYAEQVEKDLSIVKLDPNERKRVRVTDSRTAVVLQHLSNYSDIEKSYFLDYFAHDLRDEKQIIKKYGSDYIHLEKTRKKILREIKKWDK